MIPGTSQRDLDRVSTRRLLDGDSDDDEIQDPEERSRRQRARERALAGPFVDSDLHLATLRPLDPDVDKLYRRERARQALPRMQGLVFFVHVIQLSITVQRAFGVGSLYEQLPLTPLLVGTVLSALMFVGLMLSKRSLLRHMWATARVVAILSVANVCSMYFSFAIGGYECSEGPGMVMVIAFAMVFMNSLVLRLPLLEALFFDALLVGTLVVVNTESAAMFAGDVLLNAEESTFSPCAHDVTTLVSLAAMFVVVVYLVELTDVRSFITLQRARDGAQRATSTKQAFLRYCFHEVRVPLNAVVCGLQIMNQGSDDPDVLRMVSGQADVAVHILNQTLLYDKLEQGGLELRPAEFSPRQITEAVLWAYKAAAKSKNIALTVKVADNVPDSVVADATRVQQCVANFVGNALRFTPAHGRVEIKVTRPRNNPKVRLARNLYPPAFDNAKCVDLRFSVRDTGVGISPADQRKLFQPFVQIAAGVQQKGLGTGLGLSIARAVIDAHGGTIGVSSRSVASSVADRSGAPTGSEFWFVVRCPLPGGAMALLPTSSLVLRKDASFATSAHSNAAGAGRGGRGRVAPRTSSGAASGASGDRTGRTPKSTPHMRARSRHKRTGRGSRSGSGSSSSGDSGSASGSGSDTSASEAEVRGAARASGASEAETKEATELRRITTRLLNGSKGTPKKQTRATEMWNSATTGVTADAFTSSSWLDGTETFSAQASDADDDAEWLARRTSGAGRPRVDVTVYDTDGGNPDAQPAASPKVGSASRGRRGEGPRSGAAASAGAGAAAEPPPPAPIARRALVVEDSRTNRRLIARLLSLLNVEGGTVHVDTAQDGSVGVDMVQRSVDTGVHYDVVLMDVSMPVMDGVEATRRISKFTNVPIVGCSGNALASDVAALREAGAVDYLTKPISMDSLVTSLTLLGWRFKAPEQ